MPNNEMIEISGEIVEDRRASYLFYDGTKSVFLPKSLVEWDSDEKVMRVPEWMAMEKGLI